MKIVKEIRFQFGPSFNPKTVELVFTDGSKYLEENNVTRNGRAATIEDLTPREKFDFWLIWNGVRNYTSDIFLALKDFGYSIKDPEGKELDEIYNSVGKEASKENAVQKRQDIIDGLKTPIELLGFSKINYDLKSGQYSATFVGCERSITLRINNEVVAFLTQHAKDYGSWMGRIETGVLTEVNLV